MGRVVLSVDGVIPQRQGREGGGCFFFLGERGGSVVSDWHWDCIGKQQTNQRENVCHKCFCTKGATKLHNFVTLQHFPDLPDYQGDVLAWIPLI